MSRKSRRELAEFCEALDETYRNAYRAAVRGRTEWLPVPNGADQLQSVAIIRMRRCGTEDGTRERRRIGMELWNERIRTDDAIDAVVAEPAGDTKGQQP